MATIGEESGCVSVVAHYPDRMPTVLRLGPYRVFFYSSDQEEPVHVHVQREGAVAKFWLEPVRLARSGGFGRQELLDIQRIVVDNRERLIEAWHEHFGN
jgi:hypothetical protein